MNGKILGPVTVDTTLTGKKSLLLARLIKDHGHWDGCDDPLTEDISYCEECKYEGYCKKLREEK